MKPVMGTLCHMGIRLIIYLDDLLVSMEELAQICQLFEALGHSEEIHTDTTPESAVLGLPGRHSQPTAYFPSRKAEENTTACPTPPSPTKYLSERFSEVCGENLSINMGHMASSSTF